MALNTVSIVELRLTESEYQHILEAINDAVKFADHDPEKCCELSMKLVKAMAIGGVDTDAILKRMTWGD